MIKINPKSQAIKKTSHATGYIILGISIIVLMISGCARWLPAQDVQHDNRIDTQPAVLSQNLSGNVRDFEEDYALRLYDSNQVERGWWGVVNTAWWILTARHVVEESNNRLSLELWVQSIHFHPTLDLALIQIDPALIENVLPVCRWLSETTLSEIAWTETTSMGKIPTENTPSENTITQKTTHFTRPISYGMSGLPVSDTQGVVRWVLVSKDTSQPARGQVVLFTNEIMQRIVDTAGSVWCGIELS